MNEIIQPTVDSTNNQLPPPIASDAFNMAPRKSPLPTQAIIIALILGVSAASLYFMRRIGMNSGMDMNLGIEPVALKLGDEDAGKAKNYERIMADLQRVQKPLDVALGEFGKSTFLVSSPVTGETVVVQERDPIKEAAEKKRLEREAQHQKVAQAFASLHLQSVMQGRVPLARINGDVLRVGEPVGEFFTLTAIRGREVEIASETDTFRLSMDADEGGMGKDSGKNKSHAPK